MGEIQTGSFRDVARYKLEQAKDDLDSAKLLLEAGKYKAANNRAYYSCFHAVDEHTNEKKINDVEFVEGLQIMDNRIIFNYAGSSEDSAYFETYVSIDRENGEILVSATPSH